MVEVDLADDWQYIDGLETCTIISNDDPENEIEVEGCCSNEISNEQMGGSYGLESSKMAWSIPTANMQGMILLQGYTIRQEDGTEWIVNSNNLSTFASRYKVNTTRRE